MSAGLEPHTFTPAQGQLIVRGAGAQELHEVGLSVGEEAGTNLAVGRQAGAGAGATEGLGHRSDDAHAAQGFGAVDGEPGLIQGSTERVDLPQSSRRIAACFAY